MRKIIPFALSIFLFVSCSNSTEKATETQQTDHERVTSMQMQTDPSSQQVALGDIVPNELVCMVNNDYMGREQLEVKVNGKIYYGCCDMCQDRLPVDESVRVAIDPISQKQVDKADAVIAVTGERGEVSYFENKENHQKYTETVLN
ncbi:MAG TPA: hypothetical protein VK102_01150 [Sphingobacterium sp.]|nr:hypothetical protein [Sphingobacterium sp.]